MSTPSPSDFFRSAISAIDWKSLEAEFFRNGSNIEKVADSCHRLALWTNELQHTEKQNPALPFILEMQRSSHDVAALFAVAMYVPAAAAMRSVCEAALFYSYFRSHPAELITIANRSSYYIQKSEIMEYHAIHSPGYRNAARVFDFPSRLDSWYSSVSAIVHGQRPGAWGKRLKLSDTKHDSSVLDLAVNTFTEGVSMINDFLLLTIATELWSGFRFSTKGVLLKGMLPERRELLGFDGK